MDVLASLIFFRNAAIFSAGVFACELCGRLFGDDVDNAFDIGGTM